ncbi:MAG: hypothetical protein RKE49_02165 [Oceanicaulis sp.]
MTDEDPISPWGAAFRCGLFYLAFGPIALAVSGTLSLQMQGWASLIPVAAFQVGAVALCAYLAVKSYDGRPGGAPPASRFGLIARFAAVITLVAFSAPLVAGMVISDGSVAGGMAGFAIMAMGLPVAAATALLGVPAGVLLARR